MKQTQHAASGTLLSRPHFKTLFSRVGPLSVILSAISLLGACASSGPSVSPISAPEKAPVSASNSSVPGSAPAAQRPLPSAPSAASATAAKAVKPKASSVPEVPSAIAAIPSSTSGSAASTSGSAASTSGSAASTSAQPPKTGAPAKTEDSIAPIAADTAPPQLSASEEKDLWDRIRRGFSMPDLDSSLVADKERAYLAQPAYLQRMMTRGGRYLFFIVEELERRNMPTEIALLPFVESAMNPVAMSSAKASGLWQFIPSTGKAYDLHQNWWVDNRRDVVKSTRAALDYLQKIYAMHGNDWFLALASYNWGEGSVGRAVKAAKGKGLSGDYLSLSMPNETRHYVPKLLALKGIIQRSEQLNIALPAMPNRPYFATIEKTRPIDLKLAAKFAGMTVDEFVALNPAHNRPVIAASKNNEIKLPADRVESFMEAMQKHTDDKGVMASWQPYTIQSGENLSQIAQRGSSSEAEIRKANGLRAESRILPGTKLLVPHARVADESKVESFVAPRVYEQVSIPAQHHTVGKKENLAGIAKRFGTSVANLKAWNGIKKVAARGMNLVVRPSYSQTVLTEESGQRQVVGSSQRLSAVVAKPEEDQSKNPEVQRPSTKTERVQVVVKKGAKTESGKPAVKAIAKVKPTAIKHTKVVAKKGFEKPKLAVKSKASEKPQKSSDKKSKRA